MGASIAPLTPDVSDKEIQSQIENLLDPDSTSQEPEKKQDRTTDGPPLKAQDAQESERVEETPEEPEPVESEEPEEPTGEDEPPNLGRHARG